MWDPEEIAEHTNRIGELLDQADAARGAVRRGRIAEALHASCRLLGRLDSTSLSSWEETRDGVPPAWDEALAEVAGDPRRFEDFVRIEESLLLAAGVKRKVAAWIIERLREIPRELERPGGFVTDVHSVREFIEALERLRGYVCSEADHMVQRIKRRRIVRGILSASGGICLVAVNVGADSLLSGVATAASAGAGAGFVQDAVKTFSEDG